jgi:Recombinase zinc beta ribbon domain/Recombinase
MHGPAGCLLPLPPNRRVPCPTLYATGRFSFQTLADHLNSLGIRPKRGPGKTKHNRPAAVIFTGDVLKDIFDNPSYLGKVKVDGQLIEAKHPALIDEATWNHCLEVRKRNRRNTSKTWTRHSYPLTPVLRCGRCGSTMHGEVASDASGSRRYYACHAARRQRAATRLPLARCDARAIRSERIEEAIRHELGRCLPSDDMHAAYRAQLERSIATPRSPRDVREARLRSLDDQLARVRQLYEYGEYDWETFIAKRAETHDAQQSLRDEASMTPQEGDLEWCRGQLLDLVAAWDAADDDQRSRLLGALFESVDAEALPQKGSGSPPSRAAHGSGSSSRWYWSGRRGSPAPVPPARTELTSLIGSVALRKGGSSRE